MAVEMFEWSVNVHNSKEKIVVPEALTNEKMKLIICTALLVLNVVSSGFAYQTTLNSADQTTITAATLGIVVVHLGLWMYACGIQYGLKVRTGKLA